MAAPALPRGRGGAAAPPEKGGNYGQGQPIAHEPVLRVPRGAGTEASREGAVRRDRRGGRRDARDAGRRRDGGGERLTRPRARLPPGGAQARRGDVAGRPGEGQGRDHAARAAPGAGGPCGRGPDDVGEGLPRGHRRPRRVGHRGGTSGGSPTGAAQGSGNAPDGGRRQRLPARRGNAAVVTGPYGASLKPPATPGDLYRVLTWNSVPGSRTLNLDGMRTVVAREPIRVDSQMPRVPS